MSDIVNDLSLDGVIRAVDDLIRSGAPIRGAKSSPHLSDKNNTGHPCVVTTTDGGQAFDIYIHNRQSLCFQSFIKKPLAGFTDVATWWNLNSRFSKVIPYHEGYNMRFEADICFGVTRTNLRFMIAQFSKSIVEFEELLNRLSDEQAT